MARKGSRSSDGYVRTRYVTEGAGQQFKSKFMRRTRAVAIVMTIAVATLAVPFSTSAEDGASVEAAADARASLGLDADLTLVAELRGSANDVGTAEWGIPMTADEAEAVDLAGRMAFADQIDQDVRPWLESLPTFAGLYFDQINGGSLTVLLTQSSDDVAAKLDALVGEASFEVHVRTATHSTAELMDALHEVPEVLKEAGSEVGILSSSLNVDQNSITLGFAEGTMPGEAIQRSIAQLLGVDVQFETSVDAVPAHCTVNRDHCHNPMKAGVLIKNGNNRLCTMGSHILRSNGDRQFVTSGHCGYNTSTIWYHTGFGLGSIGTAVQTLYVEGGQDIMRVTLASGEDSDLVFDESGDVTGSGGSPVDNEVLCASLGNTDQVRCGVVTEIWESWYFPGWGEYTLWGGDMAFSIGGGRQRITALPKTKCEQHQAYRSDVKHSRAVRSS